MNKEVNFGKEISILNYNMETDTDEVNNTQKNENNKNIDNFAWKTVGIFNRNFVTLSGLTAGQSYALRVRAINSAGPGPWSKVSSYRTLANDFPAPPNNVKIITSVHGLTLTWQRARNKLVTYMVYLAVKTDGPPKLNVMYKCIYRDKGNKVLIPSWELEYAHLGSKEYKYIHFLVAPFFQGKMGPMTDFTYILKND